MRWGWPFLLYVGVAIVHLVQLGTGLPGKDVTKPLLMAALLIAVLLVALVTARGIVATRRGVLALVLLCAGIAFSLAGDVLLGSSFLAGLGSFAAAHLAYIALTIGPARTRRLPWWTLAYAVWVGLLCIVLWPHLGDLAIPVVVYGVVLAGTAATAAGVNAITAVGGLLFLASDSLLAFRLFWPDFGAVFPDPWQDLAIMTLYCLGEGLIAFGVMRSFNPRRR